MKTIKKNVSHKKKLSKKKGIYGYGRKRNNSRLKMKSNIKSNIKSKRKKSILRGGALNTVQLNPSFKKFSNVEKNENTALKEYIFVKEDFISNLDNIKINYYNIIEPPSYTFTPKTNKHKNLNKSNLSLEYKKRIRYYNTNTIVEIIKYTDSFTKYIFKNGNIYYVYPNKTKPEDPIIYSVFECTNQSITIETDINLEHTITLTPLELSVDTMQLAINTGSLQIIESTEKDTNTYLGFVNFPSLVINKVSHSYKSSRKEAIWLNVYEDEETFNYNLKESYLYKYHSNYQDKVRREEDKNKGSSNTVKRKDETINFNNNAVYFNEMKTKIKEKMLEIQNNSSVELKLELEDLFKRVFFGRFVKKEDNSISQQIDGLEWLMRNTLWLEDYLAFKDSFKLLENKNNVNTKLNFFDNPIFKEFKDNDTKYDCDFTDLDMKYIIVDEFVNNGVGGDGETYVICGYPDRRMKEIVLNFWQNIDMKKKLDEIHQEQYDNFYEWFSKLFNFFEEDNKINNNNELYKLYLQPSSKIINNLFNKYKELYKEDHEEYITKFKKNYNLYYNYIANKYIKKNITNIKYVFLAFKKNKDTTFLEPFIFNVKELKKEHKSILKRIERLIKHELPYRFDILNDSEYKNEKGNVKDPFDDEYKLWYSRYRYGKFFHIETEYVHSMSNIADKAHNYKNSIPLEELIYACGLNYEPINFQLKTNFDKTSFFENLRIEYKIREYSLESTTPKISKFSNLKNKSTDLNCKIIKNRSEKVFCLYEEDKLFKTNQLYDSNKKVKILSLTEKKLIIEHFSNKENIKKIKFILVFKTNTQEYTFIYYYNDEFYKLLIESNISQIINSVIIELNKNININAINFTEKHNILKIININKLDKKDIKYFFYYNPLIMKKIKSISYNEEIDTSYYYDTELLDIKLVSGYVQLNMINLYNLYIKSKDKPIIVQSLLANKNYLLENITNDNIISYETDFIKFKNCIDNFCENISINYIFYNVNDCGYDFIEIIDTNANKLTVFIVPTKKQTVKKGKYIGNFLNLDYESLPMLKEFKNIYNSYECVCFLHTTLTTTFFCLHFHIIKKIDFTHNINYNRIYNFNNFGSFIIKDIYINDIINNLNTNKNFYINTDYCLIKAY